MRIIYWMFLLSAMLLVLAYWQGATAFMAVFAAGVQKIAYSLTGRNERGEFVPYPGGKP